MRGVLGAIKRAVDSNPVPNRFLITGSVRADLEAQGWPLGGYVERALRGGFPEAALAASDALAHQWLDSYIEQVVTRDEDESRAPSAGERSRPALQ